MRTKPRWAFWPPAAKSERARRARTLGLVAAGGWFLLARLVAFLVGRQPAYALGTGIGGLILAVVRSPGGVVTAWVTAAWLPVPPAPWQLYAVVYLGDVINLLFWFGMGAVVGYRARDFRRAGVGLLLTFGAVFALSACLMLAFVSMAFSGHW